MSARRFVMVVALLSTCGFCNSVSAQSFPGGPINPGDNVVGGGTSSAVVSGVPAFTSVTVSVVFPQAGTPGPGHTWVGDIILRLTSPDAVVTDLLVRAGKSVAATGFGDSSNLLGTYTFDDSATSKLITAAAGGDTSFVVPNGNYWATNNTFNGDGIGFTGEVVQTLNTLNGGVGDGTWTLFFSDNAGGDYAQVESWQINFVGSSVPEPSTWAMIGASVVGMGGVAYRQLRIRQRGAKTRFTRKRTKK